MWNCINSNEILNYFFLLTRLNYIFIFLIFFRELLNEFEFIIYFGNEYLYFVNESIAQMPDISSVPSMIRSAFCLTPSPCELKLFSKGEG